MGTQLINHSLKENLMDTSLGCINVKDIILWIYHCVVSICEQNSNWYITVMYLSEKENHSQPNLQVSLI